MTRIDGDALLLMVGEENLLTGDVVANAALARERGERNEIMSRAVVRNRLVLQIMDLFIL